MFDNKKVDLATIMNKAWYLCKTYQYAFADCLKKAWAWFKLRREMLSGVSRFHFTKADGSTREAFGTLREDQIGEVKGTGRKAGENIQTYWDVEKNDYRCFKIINLI